MLFLLWQLEGIHAEIDENVFEKSDLTVDQRCRFALRNQSSLEGLQTLLNEAQNKPKELQLALVLCSLHQRSVQYNILGALEECKLEHQSSSFGHHRSGVIGIVKRGRNQEFIHKFGILKHLVGFSISRKQVKGSSAHVGPRRLERVDQEVKELGALEQSSPLQEVERLKDPVLVEVVLDAPKELLGHLEDIEQGEAAFNRLIQIQIQLAVVNYVAQKCDQPGHRPLLLDVLVVDSAQPNEELMQRLHELLSVVWECSNHAVFDEGKREFVLKGVDRLGPVRCLDHLECVQHDCAVW